MTENPKMWIGTPGEDDWRPVGEVTDLDVNIKEPGVDFEPYDPGAPITQIQDSYVVDLKLTSTADTLLEFARKYIGSVTPEQEQFYRSIMVVGTRKLAHVHPGPWRYPGMKPRVEHTRARKLYSERLRRDRRRQRKGRAPILRSGPNVRALFPRVQVDRVSRVGDIVGMRMTTSPHLDSDKVAVFDTELLYRREPPKFFDYDRPRLKDVARDYLRYPRSEPFKFTNLETS